MILMIMNYNEYHIVVLTPKITMKNYSKKTQNKKTKWKTFANWEKSYSCIVEIKFNPYA